MKTLFKTCRIILAVIATIILCFVNLIASLGSNPKQYREYAEKESSVWEKLWGWALKN